MKKILKKVWGSYLLAQEVLNSTTKQISSSIYLKVAFTRATFLQRGSKTFYAWKSLLQSGYSHETRLACRDRVRG